MSSAMDLFFGPPGRSPWVLAARGACPACLSLRLKLKDIHLRPDSAAFSHASKKYSTPSIMQLPE